MNILQTCLRWGYRIFWYSLVGLVITLAVAISLIRIFPPDVEVYRERVEQLAGAMLERQVTIKSMDARLSGFTPLIIFHDVHLLAAKGKREILRFDKASLGLDLFRSITSKKLLPKSFTIHGVNLGITRKPDGTFQVQGLNLAELEAQIGGAAEVSDSASNELSEWLFERSELAIKDSTVVWVDKIRGRKTRRFKHVNFYIRSDENRHQLTGTVSLPAEMGRDLEVDFDFAGNILNPKEWQGNFYARGNGLQIKNWGIKPAFLDTTLEKGILDLQVWGEWKSGLVHRITADISTYDFSLNLKKTNNLFEVELISGLFDWQRKSHGWSLNVGDFRYLGKSELWPRTDMTVEYNTENPDAPRIEATSTFIRLDDVRQILVEGGLLDEKTLASLKKLNPAGDLKELNAAYQLKQKDKATYFLSAKFKGLSVDAWEYFPGFKSLNGSIWLDQSIGQLQLLNSSSMLEFPRLFRKPFEVTKLDGKLLWWRQDQAWHIAARDLLLSTRDIDTDMSFTAIVPEYNASPYLDLQAHYINGDAKQAWRYYPVSIMSNNLVEWLDRGLVDGVVTEGGAIFNGRLADFPFADKSGTLLAQFNTDNVELNYQKGWPHISAIRGEVSISGLGLGVKGESAKLYDSQLRKVGVRIDKFSAPALEIQGDIEANASDVFQYLVESPIIPEAASFYVQSNITGTTTGKLKIIIPLSDRVKEYVPLHYEGYADFKDSHLSSWNKALVVDDVNGHVKFNTRGVSSDDLKGKVYGGDTKFNIFTQEIKGKQDIQLGMKGRFDAANLRKAIDLKLLDRIKGKTDWQGALSFDNKSSDKSGGFQFNSRLKGIDIDLPPPFTKTAEKEQELAVQVTFPQNDILPVKAKYGELVNLDLLVNTGDSGKGVFKKGTIQFQGGELKLPKEDQLVIRGGLLELPLEDWVDIVDDNRGTASKPILNALGAPVILDLDYLHITTREDTTEQAAADPKTVDPKAVDSRAVVPKAADPRQAALINGKITDLKIDDRHLGKFEIRTSHVKDGVSIEKLQLYSPIMKVDAEGGWYFRRGRQQTNLVINVSTENLGTMLASLGYSAIINRGKAKAVMQADWYDSPGRFDLSKLNGSLGVIIDDGRIRDVQPGAGRMLGLLSITDLPRRIFGDFGELRDGFKFDQIYGQFDIEKGDAHTDNLRVVSPIALISIHGRTGLAKRDFNQHVTVVPNVSGAVPTISWLAWGSQIGAVTFLLDQLFGEQVDESAATKYHITGSWEKPNIEKLEPNPSGALEESKSEQAQQ